MSRRQLQQARGTLALAHLLPWQVCHARRYDLAAYHIHGDYAVTNDHIRIVRQLYRSGHFVPSTTVREKLDILAREVKERRYAGLIVRCNWQNRRPSRLSALCNRCRSSGWRQVEKKHNQVAVPRSIDHPGRSGATNNHRDCLSREKFGSVKGLLIREYQPKYRREADRLHCNTGFSRTGFPLPLHLFVDTPDEDKIVLNHAHCCCRSPRPICDRLA
jgi:hypothetical protein